MAPPLEDPPPQDQTRAFDRTIAQLNETIPVLERELARQKRQARGLLWRDANLKAALALRSWENHYEYWRVGVLVVLPVGMAGAVFTLLNVLLGATPALLCALFVAAGSVWYTARALFYQTTKQLVATQQTTQVDLALVRERIAKEQRSLAAAHEERKSAVANKAALIASVNQRRERLLARNWRTMREPEWSSYMQEVFAALGTVVQLQPTADGAATCLVMTVGDHTTAVRTISHHYAVGSVPVQQALAAKATLGCHRCAVITNSRFTPAARQLAEQERCQLIDELKFADFVRGELSV